MDYDFEDRIEDLWKELKSKRPDIAKEILGGDDRNDLTGEELRDCILNYIGPIVDEMRTRRVIREEINEFREVFERRFDGLERGLVDSFSALAYGISQNLGSIASAIDRQSRETLHQIEELRAGQRELSTSYPQSASLPPPQQQPTVYMTQPSVMDCTYSKDGPKVCIRVTQTPDGTYGVCTIGDQVRRKRILPRMITTAIDQTGCPSNRVIRVCDYLKYERVKIN